jgi:hypothetical protein
MQTLKIGAQGADVRAWQEFLTAQGLNPGEVDGIFGAKTAGATKAFQSQNGLEADGIAGPNTFTKAITLGFKTPGLAVVGSDQPAPPPELQRLVAVAEEAVLPLIAFPSLGPPRAAPDWPGLPPFKPIFGLANVEREFERFDFEEIGGDNIRILGSWKAKNLVVVDIPALRSGHQFAPGGKVRFHRRGARQLQALWKAWDEAGLLARLLITYDGSFAERFKRNVQPHSRENLSNHAFGTAFDINAQQNPLGGVPALVGQPGATRELVELAYQHGFYWGGHFGSGRSDGMHFEIAVPFDK